MQQFLDALKNNFSGEISTADADLQAANHDASIFTIEPKVVAYPKTAADISALIQAANQSGGVTLTARSGGTDMGGGPLTDSVVIDVNRHMQHLELGDGEALVEPGMFYRDFEKKTLEKNWLLPSYPASREICTVGGMTANNSGGEKSLTYGKTINFVEEVHVVLHDGSQAVFKALTPSEVSSKQAKPDAEGEIYRAMHQLLAKNSEQIKAAKPNVSKNSAGYNLWEIERPDGTFDLSKLIVGSQGTLGIITATKFRLIHPKKYSRLLVIFLNDLAPLADLANHLLQFKPESLESYDDKTFRLALKVFPSLVKRLKTGIFTLAWQFLPEFLAILRGGVPKLVVLAEFTGDTVEECLQKAEAAKKSIADFHLEARVITSEHEAEKYWTIRRESFNLLRTHVQGMRAAAFIDDIVIRPADMPTFLPKIYALLEKYKDDMIYTIAGHIGDGNFHIIPLIDMKKPRSIVVIRELMDSVYDLIHQYTGSITGEHNDGLIRTPYLEKMFGKEMTALFAETKKIFDPHGIFNPKKKVGGSIDENFKHLVKE